MNLTFGLRIAALEPANLLTGTIAKLFMMMEADPLDCIAVALHGGIQANED